jgi:diguanylate cyclase (GGDEF)-like protein
MGVGPRCSAVTSSRSMRRPRLGIAATLAISFAAVALLAATANIIVKKGVAVVRTTRVESLPEAAAPAPPTPTVMPRAEPPAPVIAPITKVVHTDHLALALSRYDEAVLNRVQSAASEDEAQLAAAAMAMDRASAEFLAATKQARQRSLHDLPDAITDYRQRGDALVRLADARRDARDQYAAQFEAMNARVKTALDGAWRIFGRVVTRQSLVQLSAKVDEIRRRCVVLSEPQLPDVAALDALVASELSLANTLKDTDKELARAEGPRWVGQMREDLANLVATRSHIVDLTGQLHADSNTYLKAGLTLNQLIPPQITIALSSPAHAKKTAGTAAVAARPVLPAMAASAPQPPAPQLRSVTTSAVPIDDGRRALVAWMSGGVLLVLVVISALTVRSIVVPVRCLLEATAKLASGDVHIRVPRGGVRELDILGLAFNQMAEQLAGAQTLARDYQQQLESKVEERTLQLQRLAEHDALTLLPNRRQLFTLLNAAIARAASSNSRVGVLFLDVDNFKNINDSVGHAFGDRVLIAIATRLTEAARHFGFAARLGGDEFTVVSDGAAAIADIRDVGEQLVRAFHEPLLVDGRDLMISVSIGAGVYPDHGDSAEALLRAADAALYRAKALGRSQLTIFSPELFEMVQAKFRTEQALRRAVEFDECELLFQPEINVETMEVGLVEALLRWRMPDGRLAGPDEFLDVAEESGLIMEISDWVLRSAIAAAAQWHHGEWPQCRVAINVSPRQFLDHRFVERVHELLREFNLPPHCIEIELTESVLQTGAATLDALKRLRGLGIAIALDDFGTGYSSLASLERLPLTRIKLDRTLIASVDTNARSAAIARAIIGLCHGLGLQITAEGIERPEQFAWLLGNRATYVQGFLLARPVPQDALLQVLANIAPRLQELLLTAPAYLQQSNVVELATGGPGKPALSYQDPAGSQGA